MPEANLPLIFPGFDPIAFSLGPLVVRWYALAYIAGLVLGWRYVVHLARQSPHIVTPRHAEDMLTWATLGVILGGRLGQVLLWEPSYYLAHPGEILMIWKGGMAFHGGLIGVILAMILYARRARIPFFALADPIACATPIGLGLGRLANFVNGELWGRPVGTDSDLPWAMIFPHVDNFARHPSQIYEALGEGLLLFLLLFWAARRAAWRERLGFLSGLFLFGYGLARGFAEFFREPEIDLGTLGLYLTWGQVLSLPMIAYGLYLMRRARPRNAAPSVATGA